ncbi:MAG: ACP S-malonyltransferase [Lachnospiraceae bacterium]|jgi:[acyl-carrier-protein] S-malonyltransferase|nr:ACP S-malonyltransferase [Lachnospiraceae bacterium]MCI9622486.1 ACP S-malonyltransferase [Lachnospiraceae bacterium]
MRKLAFIYPGQGAQKAGMGADFYENSPAAGRLFDEACEALDFDLKEICFKENEKLNETQYTQPAMVTTCLAMTRVLTERGVRPDMTAGLSLGEYAAVAAAGGLKELDAILLVRKRGLLMEHAVPAGEGAMCAVLGMTGEALEKELKGMADVTIANYNCPGQMVITGKTEAVRAAAEHLKAAGAKRTIPLNVSGPFHSPFLQTAGEELRKEIEKTKLHPLRIPYVANVTAEKVERREEIADLLSKGVSSPVKWQQTMEYMIAEGVNTFVEIGPGRTLSGFLKKINTEVSVYHISSWEDVERAAGELC